MRATAPEARLGRVIEQVLGIALQEVTQPLRHRRRQKAVTHRRSSGIRAGAFFAPNFAGNETFSFLGVQFDAGERVSRVRITSGTQILASGNIGTDLVVMDDFIYAEPAAVPEPATLLLLSIGLAGLGVLRRGA